MIHLTLTGPYAGRPLCDCDRETARRKGDTFQHVSYAPFGSPLLVKDLCPVCRVVWDTVDDDDETAERKIAAARRAMEEGQTLRLDL